MMATVDLDPDFSKGLRLMFSSAKDSTEMLRAMLEEAIRAKHGTSKSLGNIPIMKSKDDDEMCIVLERDSDESASEKDDDDDEVRALMEEDLSCSVCKEISVAPGNRLIECCECQALYHQECHKPLILDKEVDDPRKTWYCSTCKQASAEAVKTTIKTTSPLSVGPSKSLRSSPAMNLRDSPSNLKQTLTQSKADTSSLFKRSEKLSSGNSTSGSSSASKPSGLAAMAASLQSSKSTSSSSKGSLSGSSKGTSSPAKGSGSTFSSGSSKSAGSSGSGSSSGKISGFSGVPSPTSSSAADKRLQNMKKKAASKLQEKRKHAK